MSLERIIFHWTAGGSRASSVDLAHYHLLVEWDGNIVKGKEEPEDNIVTSDGDYARHTLNLNGGSIGLGLCGMRGAVESPYDPGDSPITEKQFRAAAILAAELCVRYSIPVTGRTVLSHAEVQPTLGVRQRGKWDITRLPWRDDIRGAIAIGDHFRDLVRTAQVSMGVKRAPMVASGYPTLRRGSQLPAVKELQTRLKQLGYHSGATDGIFGHRTEKSVRSFQLDKNLSVDGVAGDETWNALATAEALPDREVDVDALKKESETTQSAAKSTQWSLVTAGSTVTSLVASKAQEVSGVLPMVDTAVRDHWPTLLILSAGVVVVWLYNNKVIQQRVKDAVSGKHLGR